MSPMRNNRTFYNASRGYRKMPAGDNNKGADISARFLVPCNTAKRLHPGVAPENFAVTLNKLVKFHKNNDGNEEIKIKDKGDDFWQQFDFGIYNNLITALNRRVRHFIENRYDSAEYAQLDMKSEWKVCVGLGIPSVYETSITLHHVYGLPYIPASAAKGLVRSYIVRELFNNDEQKAERNPDFCHIFGSKNASGSVIFFDAYPINKPEMVVDVINPHYKQYYGGNSWPYDYDKLSPTFFIAFKETVFRFYIAVEAEKNRRLTQIDMKMPKENMTLDFTKAWLEKSLKEHGIGAKTSVGYGYLLPC